MVIEYANHVMHLDFAELVFGTLGSALPVSGTFGYIIIIAILLVQVIHTGMLMQGATIYAQRALILVEIVQDLIQLSAKIIAITAHTI